VTDMWDDDDRAVLAHLPFDEVPPPPELEERTMAAAFARRPPGVDEVAAARQRRRNRVRLLVASAAAIIAVVAIGALIATRDQSSGSPNRIEAVSTNRADVQELLNSDGARTGTLPTGAGRVVLAADGRGDLYDLASTRSVAVAIETADGTVVLGDATPRDGIVAFHVQHPELVRAVRVTPRAGQPLRATLTPR
jgi:hypothetical protein